MDAKSLKDLSPEELAALKKRVATLIVKKIVIGVVVSVTVTLISNAIVRKIEGTDADDIV